MIDFFEDLGTLLRKGHLDEELAFHAFSYLTEGWWQIVFTSTYILRMRELDRDPTIYSEFEYFAKRMFEMDGAKRKLPCNELLMSHEECERFLKDEARQKNSHTGLMASLDPIIHSVIRCCL